MRFTLKDIFEENLTSHIINERELDKCLVNGVNKKQVGTEQLYRKPENWYMITAHTNPYKTIYSELSILNQNEKSLSKILDGYTKIFYGVGTGDTESVFVLWDVKSKRYSETIVLDAQPVFINGFITGLRNMLRDRYDGKVMFLAYRNLFEKTTKAQLKPKNKKFKHNAHICLGNTIGNFNQEEIFQLFNKNTDSGDLLILGAHLLDSDIEKMLKEYSENPLFCQLAMGVIGGDIPVDWVYNYSENQVEVWYKDVRILRTKKYQISELDSYAKAHGFKKLKHLNDKKAVIAIYEKE